MKKFPFANIGTDNLVIGIRRKTGTCSLKRLLEYPNIKENTTVNENQTVVVLIRDVIDKWKEGYFIELKNIFKEVADKNFKMFDWYPENKLFIEEMIKSHDVSGNLKVFYKNHSEFWKWNDTANLESDDLFFLTRNPNVWFVELSELSHPDFLEWIQYMDKDWNDVSEITHEHRFKEKFWDDFNLFWKDYKENKNLVNPFYNLSRDNFILGFLDRLRQRQQGMIDQIRSTHPQYLRFNK